VYKINCRSLYNVSNRFCRFNGKNTLNIIIIMLSLFLQQFTYRLLENYWICRSLPSPRDRAQRVRWRGTTFEGRVQQDRSEQHFRRGIRARCGARVRPERFPTLMLTRHCRRVADPVFVPVRLVNNNFDPNRFIGRRWRTASHKTRTICGRIFCWWIVFFFFFHGTMRPRTWYNNIFHNTFSYFPRTFYRWISTVN
jgi:hypothetical protein